MEIKVKKLTWVEEDEPPINGRLLFIFAIDPDDDAKLEEDPPTTLNLISSNV